MNVFEAIWKDKMENDFPVNKTCVSLVPSDNAIRSQCCLKEKGQK